MSLTTMAVDRGPETDDDDDCDNDTLNLVQFKFRDHQGLGRRALGFKVWVQGLGLGF